MTTDNEPRVVVTREDRARVQDFHRAMAKKLMADIASGKAPTFGDDAGHDGDTIHQAFARHRIATEDACREREAELVEDAERWRAFFGSERFYVMGAAGFDWNKAAVSEPHDETNWLHFTLNIWDRHPAHGDEQDVQARAMLLSYVDYIRRAKATTDATGEG